MFLLARVVIPRGSLFMSCCMLWDFGTSKVDLTVIDMSKYCGKTSKEVSHSMMIDGDCDGNGDGNGETSV